MAIRDKVIVMTKAGQKLEVEVARRGGSIDIEWDDRKARVIVTEQTAQGTPLGTLTIAQADVSYVLVLPDGSRME